MARPHSRTMPGNHLTYRLDRDLSRYVLRDERVVVAVRKHWMAHIRPFALSVLALAAALWVDIKAPPTSPGATMSQIFWGLWLVSLLYLAWTVLNWRRDWFVATDKRFLMFYGFITRKVAMMPLAKVTDLTFNRTIAGRILGYGDFTLESAGQHQALSQIDFIPNADQHYRKICAVLFDEEDDPDDEDGDEVDPFPDEDGRGGFDGGDGFGGGGRGGSDPAYPSAVTPGEGRGRRGRDGRGDSDDGYAVSDARAFGVPMRPSRRPGRKRSRDWDDREGGFNGGSEGGIDGGPGPDVGQRPGRRPAVEYLYRSGENVRSARRADTDEIPVVRARPMPGQPPRRRSGERPRSGEARTEELLYPPQEWLD